MEARMGRNSVVVAVLLEHSVKVATSRHSRMEMAAGGMLCSGTRLSPSHSERPDFFMGGEKKRKTHFQLAKKREIYLEKAAGGSKVGRVTSLPCANAKPPPRSKRMFHGIFSWTMSQSTVAQPGMNPGSLVNQSRTSNVKIISTQLSAKFILPNLLYSSLITW
ncbi:hypothetical protein EYF80_040378 [Liparis tanakae]|uniref:Uncharacterized protein n=1 Tax=Liparis tanakae TaxID=230148 RepID=A0A4Z2G8Z5_9TELE|nr:hypothetical protein EYF80_040378 [Liparis tanakae]